MQEHMSTILLSRYEVSRIVGLRALQLDEGAPPFVPVLEGDTSLSIAVRELDTRKLRVMVCRDGVMHSVQTARFPRDMRVLVDTMRESVSYEN